MGGEDANVEIALARSLVNHMEADDACRSWSKVTDPGRDLNHSSQPTAGSPMFLPTTGSRQRSLFDCFDEFLAEAGEVATLST